MYLLQNKMCSTATLFPEDPLASGDMSQKDEGKLKLFSCEQEISL